MSEPAQRSGRPLKPGAKRRDPNMESSTVLLRRRTKAQVRYILGQKSYNDGRGMDLSDLCNLLLSQWVQQQEALDPTLKLDAAGVVRLREIE